MHLWAILRSKSSSDKPRSEGITAELKIANIAKEESEVDAEGSRGNQRRFPGASEAIIFKMKL